MWWLERPFNMSDKVEPEAEVEGAAPGAVLTLAARRALEEAAVRRKGAEIVSALPAEKGGPEGPEPTRYGDWERKGRAVDF